MRTRNACVLPGSLTELAREYLTEYASKRTWEREDKRYLDRYILPELGHHTPLEVTVPDVRRLFRRVTDKHGAVNTNRMRTVLHGVYEWTFKTARLDPDDVKNPTKYVQPNTESTGRDRPLEYAEVELKWHALKRYANPEPLPGNARSAEELGLRRGAVAVYKLLLFTGCRKSEVASLRWADVDLVRRQFTLTRTKTGAKRIVPLSRPAYDIIGALPQHGEWVLPGRHAGEQIRSLNQPWSVVCRDASIEGLTVHDLRRTVASSLAHAGASPGITSEALGRRLVGITHQAYVRVASEAVREVREEYAERLLAAARGVINSAMLPCIFTRELSLLFSKPWLVMYSAH